MSFEIAIKVDNLGKCYQIYDQPHDRLKQFVLPRLQGMLGLQAKQYFREFWALKNVSFEIKKGETLGIIGRNGSGKSTLLQLICGTLNPTVGNVQANGRIAALLELGSGFNPEFTGRENIYLNGALLGLSKSELDERFDSIASFADIGDFIEQPVKTYSSGMFVRLAFAVQANVSPEILIVDEALAVGDAKFQAKCFSRLKYLKDNGASIVLVTHSSEQIVMHCSRALLLEGGKVLEIGKPSSVVNLYNDLLFGKDKRSSSSFLSFADTTPSSQEVNQKFSLNFSEDIFALHPGYNPHEYRWGDGRAVILDFELLVNGEAYPTSILSGQYVNLTISAKFLENIISPIFGITVKTKEGVTVYGINSEKLNLVDFQSLGQAGQVACVKASFCCPLAPGDYFISLGIASRFGEDITPHDRRYDAIHFEVPQPSIFFGLVDLDLELSVLKTI